MSNIGNKETMAKNLTYYINLSGKTQKELAELVGVATSTFNDWVKAKKYPRIDKIEILADYFGILKSDLIEEKTEEHKKRQSNNEALTSIIIRLRTDVEFLSLVKTLHGLNSSEISKVTKMLDALFK